MNEQNEGKKRLDIMYRWRISSMNYFQEGLSIYFLHVIDLKKKKTSNLHSTSIQFTSRLSK